MTSLPHLLKKMRMTVLVSYDTTQDNLLRGVLSSRLTKTFVWWSFNGFPSKPPFAFQDSYYESNFTFTLIKIHIMMFSYFPFCNHLLLTLLLFLSVDSNMFRFRFVYVFCLYKAFVILYQGIGFLPLLSPCKHNTL